MLDGFSGGVADQKHVELVQLHGVALSAHLWREDDLDVEFEATLFALTAEVLTPGPVQKVHFRSQRLVLAQFNHLDRPLHQIDVGILKLVEKVSLSFLVLEDDLFDLLVEFDEAGDSRWLTDHLSQFVQVDCVLAVLVLRLQIASASASERGGSRT